LHSFGFPILDASKNLGTNSFLVLDDDFGVVVESS
jgi:hypothetical protein